MAPERAIAIVGGTGPQGSGLALRWARAGQRIVIGSRDAERARAKAAEISAQTRNTDITGAGNTEAISAARKSFIADENPAEIRLW